MGFGWCAARPLWMPVACVGALVSKQEGARGRGFEYRLYTSPCPSVNILVFELNLRLSRCRIPASIAPPFFPPHMGTYGAKPRNRTPIGRVDSCSRSNTRTVGVVLLKQSKRNTRFDLISYFLLYICTQKKRQLLPRCLYLLPSLASWT